jgi:hypothetical protein
MKKNLQEALITVLPGLITSAYVLIRIFTVPVTHDEPQTCLTYAQFPVWDIITNRSYDYNNHIFNTLLVKLFSWAFGFHQWSVRLPNFIGFLLFYSFGVMLLKKIFIPQWQLLAAVILLTFNPYLLDFFGLARGYGLSSGLMVASIYFTACYIETGKTNHLIYSLLMGMAASYTQFVMLYYFAALSGCMILYFLFIKGRPVTHGLITISSVIVLLLIVYKPISELLIHNPGLKWGINDFLEDTVYTLISGLNYHKGFAFISSKETLVILIFSGLLLSVITIIVFRKNFNQYQYRLLLLLGVLLFGAATASILQNKIMHTGYQIARTSLFLFPLFMLFILAAISTVQQRLKKIVALLFTLGVTGLFHFIQNANITSTYEWPFNANEKKVIQYLQTQHNKGYPQISLNANWHFSPSFWFYKESYKLHWLHLAPFHTAPQENNASLFYYTYINEAPQINSCYTPVLSFNSSKQMLFKCHW